MQNSKTPAHQLTSKTTTNKFTPVHQFISSIQSTGNLMSRAVVNRGAGDTSTEDTDVPSGGNLSTVQRIKKKSVRSPEDTSIPRGENLATVQRTTKGPMNSVSSLTLVAQEFWKNTLNFGTNMDSVQSYKNYNFFVVLPSLLLSVDLLRVFYYWSV